VLKRGHKEHPFERCWAGELGESHLHRRLRVSLATVCSEHLRSALERFDERQRRRVRRRSHDDEVRSLGKARARGTEGSLSPNNLAGHVLKKKLFLLLLLHGLGKDGRSHSRSLLRCRLRTGATLAFRCHSLSLLGVALLELRFCHLAGPRHRELRANLHLSRHFVVCEALPAVFLQLRLRQRRGVGVQHHRGFDELPERLIRNAVHCAALDRRMVHNHLFHLDAVDVLRPCQDHILDAVNNREVAKGLHDGHVPGPEPSTILE